MAVCYPAGVPQGSPAGCVGPAEELEIVLSPRCLFGTARPDKLFGRAGCRRRIQMVSSIRPHSAPKGRVILVCRAEYRRLLRSGWDCRVGRAATGFRLCADDGSRRARFPNL